jgi:hypothetical protein
VGVQLGEQSGLAEAIEALAVELWARMGSGAARAKLKEKVQ